MASNNSGAGITVAALMVIAAIMIVALLIATGMIDVSGNKGSDDGLDPIVPAAAPLYPSY